MNGPRNKPRNPYAAICPKCWVTFPDIWAYKQHQDECAAKPAPPRKRATVTVHHI